MTATAEMVKYDVTNTMIAEMSDRYMGLLVKDPNDADGFKVAHNARMIVKGKRIEVEKKRKELGADALAYGRAVNSEAKRITALLRPIEDHLISQERVVLDEKERKAEAERVRLAEVEEAKLRAERAVYEQKLRDERDRLAAERAEMDAERERVAAAQKIERERLSAIADKQKAEADKLAAAKARIEQEEYERLRAIAFDQEKEEAVARAKADAEQAAEEAKAREEAAKVVAEQDRKRLAAMRPDVEKIRAYGEALLSVPLPTIKDEMARSHLLMVSEAVAKSAYRCRDYCLTDLPPNKEK